MDKTYKGLLMIIAISLVFINIQLFFQSFVLPSHASSGVTKIAICDENGSRCSSVMQTGKYDPLGVYVYTNR